MDVTVEDQGGLKRKLTVEVPLEDVSAAYDAVYHRIRENVRVNGFRPGKFPKQLAEKRFRKLMGQEALQNLVPRYLEQVLREKEIQPATEPKFDILEIDQKRPLRFNVEFEVVPDFELLELSHFSLTEKPIEVQPEAVEERIETLRSRRATPKPKTEGVAEKGDVVTFDFEAKIDGEPFDGNTGTNQKAELGTGRYLMALEDALLGTTAEDEKTFPLAFPEDYSEASLAGKTATFTVKVKQVEAKELPQLDGDFFASLGEGIDSMDALREKIDQQLREEQRREHDQAAGRALTEQVQAKYSFDVPEAIVQSSVEAALKDKQKQDPALKDDAQALERLAAEEAEQKRANLRLAYILARHAREEQIEVDPQELRQQFYMQAYMMQQNPEELMRTRMGELMLHQLQENLQNQKTLERLVNRILGRPIEIPPPAETAPATVDTHADTHADTSAEGEAAPDPAASAVADPPDPAAKVGGQPGSDTTGSPGAESR